MIQKYFTTGGGGNEEDVSQGFTFSDQLIIQKYFKSTSLVEEEMKRMSPKVSLSLASLINIV